jgi:hypothetical protein
VIKHERVCEIVVVGNWMCIRLGGLVWDDIYEHANL